MLIIFTRIDAPHLQTIAAYCCAICLISNQSLVSSTIKNFHLTNLLTKLK